MSPLLAFILGIVLVLGLYLVFLLIARVNDKTQEVYNKVFCSTT